MIQYWDFMTNQTMEQTSVTYKIKTGCGNLYVTIDTSSDKPEIFAFLGKAGGCAQVQVDTISRMITLAISNGAPLEIIYKILLGSKCSHPSLEADSCGDGIAKAINKFLTKELQDGSQCQ